MVDAPEVPQHLVSLAKANAIRLKRAAVKRDVKAGRTTIRDVLKVDEFDLADVDTLEDVDPAVAGMTIGELLGTQARWGPNRVRKLLGDVAVPESKPLGELTSRRRRLIVAALESRDHATRTEARRIETRRAYRAEQERLRLVRAEAARLEAEATEQRALGPVAALDVECPYCRSGPGEACSTYDPVRDLWTEPDTPHRPRLKRAGLLP